MNFASPWRFAPYRGTVAAARVLLRPFGRLEEIFVEALVRRQNRRVHRHLKRNPPRELLLIMPRCVKKSSCRAPVEQGLQECLACRECPLGDVAELCGRFEVEALVALRSHIAFALARERRPDAIVACACHDRLVKALRSVPEFPALLAPLPTLEGRCRNAGLDLAWLEEQLNSFCNARPGRARQAAAGEGP